MGHSNTPVDDEKVENRSASSLTKPRSGLILQFPFLLCLQTVARLHFRKIILFQGSIYSAWILQCDLKKNLDISCISPCLPSALQHREIISWWFYYLKGFSLALFLLFILQSCATYFIIIFSVAALTPISISDLFIVKLRSPMRGAICIPAPSPQLLPSACANDGNQLIRQLMRWPAFTSADLAQIMRTREIKV